MFVLVKSFAEWQINEDFSWVGTVGVCMIFFTKLLSFADVVIQNQTAVRLYIFPAKMSDSVATCSNP